MLSVWNIRILWSLNASEVFHFLLEECCLFFIIIFFNVVLFFSFFSWHTLWQTTFHQRQSNSVPQKWHHLHHHHLQSKHWSREWNWRVKVWSINIPVYISNKQKALCSSSSLSSLLSLLSPLLSSSSSSSSSSLSSSSSSPSCSLSLSLLLYYHYYSYNDFYRPKCIFFRT